MLLSSCSKAILGTALAVWTAAAVPSASSLSTHQQHSRRDPSHHHIKRDAYTTFTASETNTEGESHSNITAPPGSVFTSIPVGKGGEEIAAYWTAGAANKSATQAFIMIHGKLRNGDEYWTTMDDILTSAVQDNVTGADKNSIIIAPQFFSTTLNSGQYSSDMLAWGDVNTWQAGDVATHPANTKLNSFDALDAIVDLLTDQSTYPSLKNITVVGHGGGGQLNQRYSMTAQDSPNGIHIRYIHGDPSSCAYFTNDRPVGTADGQTLPTIASCGLYNTWRYGFDNFTGTASGLLTPQQYFQQYITRDIISIVGYEDTAANGDTTCMGEIQGGTKRRDRNLSWWQYVNTLARTNEDLNGFPSIYQNIPNWSNISNNVINLQLIVVENADHNATEVFSSDVGRASLFSTGKMPTGWRPAGWQAAPPANASSSAKSTTSSAQGSSKSASSDANQSSTTSSASSLLFSLTAASTFSLFFLSAAAALLLLS